MSDVIITVRGEDEERRAPERATLHLSVRADAPARDEVVRRVLARSETVRERIAAASAAGSILDWSSARLAVCVERPWGDGGVRHDPVHTAAVEFTATFADAGELSAWVSDASTLDDVEISEVHWHLTAQTRAALERDVAARAVGIAVARAKAYAEALGLHSVVPLEVADPGFLAPEGGPRPLRAMRATAFDAAGAAVSYRPDDIVVAAAVEARFAAR